MNCSQFFMSRHRALCIGIAFLGAFWPEARAAQLFVSPTGSDFASGSLAAPFQTVNKAISVAQPGDSVELRAGTYREQINAVRSGMAGSPITIENYNGEQAILSALDVVPGPWTAQGNGIYATTVTGSRPVNFWTTLTATANGSTITDSGGSLRFIVANEATTETLQVRSQAASSAWDFFSSAVTWKVRGLSAASTGTTPIPASNMNAYFSVMTGTVNGFASDDSASVYYRGDGRLQLYLKKNTVNSWGTVAQTVTDATISGYDLTLGPVSGGSVPYTFTVKRSSGADVVTTGSWAITQADWSDGGTGNTSYLGLLAQENVTVTNTAQKFMVSADSYTITKGATTVLRDEFDDGDAATVTEFPAGNTSSLSSGYDQVFVDGVMQDEARMPNRGASTIMQPTTASVTVNNATTTTNPGTISSTTFGGQAANFFAGARFLGGIGKKWSWQNAVIASSSGNLLTPDPATESTWWWPDYDGAANTSDTGTGFVYGLLSLLDADGEWFLDQPTAKLSLRITGGADPTGHVVEIKHRNWCVNADGFDYITVRGVKMIGGAIRLNGTGNVLDSCDASYLSHYLVWSNGSFKDGGRAEGGGVILSGTGATVRNCTIHDTAGSGIVTSGTGHLITRNNIYNIDYSGTYAIPLELGGTGMIATFNTIHDTGRDGLHPGTGSTVMFNDISYVGRLAHDLGCIYTFGTEAIAASGARTRIAYNWVHDRGDTSDRLSKGIYLDNGARNYVVDHNVCWNCGAITTDGAFRLNTPAFGHELYHNTIIAAGGYNDATFSDYVSPSFSLGGYVFTDATCGLTFIGKNNIEVPDASATLAFTNYATQDFTPLTTYNFNDARYGSTIATVNPPASTGSVSWTKPTGTSTTNPYLSVSLSDTTQPFFYNETYGHGQNLTGINAWVPDGQPDSGAYERGVARWIPGVNGWDGWQTDPLVALGARTAILQGVRVSTDSTVSTNLRLYYGTTDGGTNPAAWDTFTDLGTVAPGDVVSVSRTALAALTPGTAYFARYYASNANGTTWSAAQSFTTAASLTWDAGGGTTTNISTTTNWLGDLTPDLSGGGEIATFASAGSTVTIDTNVSLLGLVINRDANFTVANGTGSLTLGAGGITVTLPSTTARTHVLAESNVILAADQTWSINNNTGTAQLNVTSSIGGAYGFTKTGTGNLLLGSNSTFDGAVNVNVGPVVISSANALGSNVGASSIAATGSTTTGGQVSISGNITTPENFIITGTSEVSPFAFPLNNSSGTNTISGSISLVGTSGVRFGASAGILNLNGPISRSGTDNGTLLLAASTGAVVNVNTVIDLNGGGLSIINPGTVTLAAQSTDIGSTTIFFGSPATNGPTLKLGINDALPTNKNLTLGTTGTSNGADRGTLDLAGFNQTVNGLIGSVGTGTSPSAASTRRITNSAAGTLSTFTVGNGNTNSSFSGLIENGTGQVALTKVGSGTLTLPTANTYTGDTTVAGGILSLGTASLAITSAVNLSGGAVLNLNFSGTNNITTLRINGLVQAPGTWGSLTSSATHKTALISGNGLLNMTGTQPSYDAWALAVGLDNSTPSKDATLTADPDHDGVSNLMEYATKMNGAVNDTVPASAAKTSSGMDFTYTKNKAATDVTYTVEWSDTLNATDWSNTGVSAPTILSDNGITQQIKVTVPTSIGVTRRFVRLKVAR
jgi:autotransporter-associated beta strand protein